MKNFSIALILFILVWAGAYIYAYAVSQRHLAVKSVELDKLGEQVMAKSKVEAKKHFRVTAGPTVWISDGPVRIERNGVGSFLVQGIEVTVVGNFTVEEVP